MSLEYRTPTDVYAACMNYANPLEILNFRRRMCKSDGIDFCTKCRKFATNIDYELPTMETECEQCYIKRMAQKNNGFAKLLRQNILRDFIMTSARKINCL